MTSRQKAPTSSHSPAAEATSRRRRSRKVQRTRRHIAEEAIRLFIDKGFAATTIEEIVDAADYSTSTFFRLFADKEEVIFYDFVERLEELKETFVAPHEGNAWATIRKAFIDFAERWDADGELARQRARLFHEEPTLRSRYLAKNHEWEGAIAGLVADELGNDATGHLNAYLIAGTAVAAFRCAWRSQLEQDDIALAACVSQAFGQLENIGGFFKPGRRRRSAPA